MAKLLAKRKKHALGTGKAQAAGQQSGVGCHCPSHQVVSKQMYRDLLLDHLR